MNAYWKRPLAVLFLLILSILLIACGGRDEPETPETGEVDTGAAVEETAAEEAEEPEEEPVEEAMEGPVSLTMWYHGAGNETERSILLNIIDDFNASQSDYVVSTRKALLPSSNMPSKINIWQTSPTALAWCHPPLARPH